MRAGRLVADSDRFKVIFDRAAKIDGTSYQEAYAHIPVVRKAGVRAGDRVKADCAIHRFDESSALVVSRLQKIPPAEPA